MNNVRQDTFKLTHQEVTSHWDPATDYDLIPIDKGFCDFCPLKEAKDKRVITQRGADKLDVRIGCCFQCLKRELPVQTFLAVDANFIDSDTSFEYHSILITCDALQKLYDKTYPHNISENEREMVGTILKSEIFSRKLKLADIPGQCKQCLGVKKEIAVTYRIFDGKPNASRDNYSFVETNRDTKSSIELTNQLRTVEKCHTIFCLSCMSAIEYANPGGDACSMLSCSGCQLSACKFCAYCLNGATENEDGSAVEHDMNKCSIKRKEAWIEQKPLPRIRSCKCE